MSARGVFARRCGVAGAAEVTMCNWSSLFRESGGCQTLRYTPACCDIETQGLVQRWPAHVRQSRPDDPVKMIDAMLSLKLLIPDQCHQTSA